MPLPTRHSKPGPLLAYLSALPVREPHILKEARRAVEAIKAVLATDDGLILLDLLEKSTTDYFLSPDSDERALDALNAQRFIALDLRRIASDETDELLRQVPVERGRTGGRG